MNAALRTKCDAFLYFTIGSKDIDPIPIRFDKPVTLERALLTLTKEMVLVLEEVEQYSDREINCARAEARRHISRELHLISTAISSKRQDSASDENAASYKSMDYEELVGLEVKFKNNLTKEAQERFLVTETRSCFQVVDLVPFELVIEQANHWVMISTKPLDFIIRRGRTLPPPTLLMINRSIHTVDSPFWDQPTEPCRIIEDNDSECDEAQDLRAKRKHFLK